MGVTFIFFYLEAIFSQSILKLLANYEGDHMIKLKTVTLKFLK